VASAQFEAAIKAHSGSLPQPRQHLQPGIAVRRHEASFALEGANRDHGVMPDPPVGAAGVEAESRQPSLDLLTKRRKLWWGLYVRDFRQAVCPQYMRQRRYAKYVVAHEVHYLITPQHHLNRDGRLTFWRTWGRRTA
jgi:hypothetical protein